MKITGQKIWNGIGGRKFLGVVLTWATYTYMVSMAFAKDSSDAWSFLTFATPWFLGVVGVWMGFNVWQKVATNGKTGKS